MLPERGGGWQRPGAIMSRSCLRVLDDLHPAIDLEAARTCYQKAAEGGDGHERNRLVDTYEESELGLEINFEASFTWY